MADEYLTKAQALPDPSSPIIPILIGGVALVVLAGGLFFLVSRRRKKSKGASGGGYPLPLVPEADVLFPLARTGAYAAQALPSPPSQLADAEVVRGVLRGHDDAEPHRPLMPVWFDRSAGAFERAPRHVGRRGTNSGASQQAQREVRDEYSSAGGPRASGVAGASGHDRSTRTGCGGSGAATGGE